MLPHSFMSPVMILSLGYCHVLSLSGIPTCQNVYWQWQNIYKTICQLGTVCPTGQSKNYYFQSEKHQTLPSRQAKIHEGISFNATPQHCYLWTDTTNECLCIPQINEKHKMFPHTDHSWQRRVLACACRKLSLDISTTF